jgi:hypothetical protein
MRKFSTYLAGSAIALAALATSASATSLSFGGFNNGNAGVSTTNSGSNPNRNVNAGVFTMNNNTAGGSFLAWCLDLYSNLANSDYTALTGPFTGPSTGANPNPFSGTNGPVLSNTQLGSIENLFETNGTAIQALYGGSNNVQSAGFQLALWEIIYETGAGGYSLGAGTFQSTSGTAGVISAANTFLGNLGGSIQQDYNLTFWESDTGTSQNLVSISAVPVPAAGLLLLTGLAGFGVAARRRKNKS